MPRLNSFFSLFGVMMLVAAVLLTGCSQRQTGNPLCHLSTLMCTALEQRIPIVGSSLEPSRRFYAAW